MATSSTAPAYTALVVSGTTATGVAAARFIVGYVNLSSSAQTATVALVDNNNNPLPSVAALGASQVLTLPSPGYPCQGFSATASAAPTTGIAILYRTAL